MADYGGEFRASIALVEDDPSLVKLLPEMLDRIGYSVAGVASDADGMVSMLAETEPDLVLMDIHLAGNTDGIEAAKAIRSVFGLPVVFLTGHGDKDTVERAKGAEPFGYILKPVTLRDLEVGVEIALHRHRLEERVIESERWLAATLGNLGDGVVTTDELSRVKLVNAAFLGLVESSTAEVVGSSIVDVLRSPATTSTDLDLPGLCSSPTVHTAEIDLIGRSGSSRPVELRVAPIFGSEQRRVGQVLVLRDLTERRLAAQASTLKDYRELLEHAHDAVLILSVDGTVLETNQRMRELYGFSAQEVAGLTLQVLSKEPAQARRLLHTTLAEGGCRGFEMVHLCNDGSEMVVEVNAAQVRYREQQAIMAINRDVTERRRAEHALQQSQSQLRRLAEHLQAAREQERVAVARTIHDELGQQLTALKLDLSWARKRLPAAAGTVDDKMVSMIRLVEEAIKTVQQLTINLRPSLLDNLGLAAAAEWLVAGLARRADIEMRLEIDPPEPEIDAELSVVLFRLLQESLNNVIRHASASQVRVSLRCNDEQAELRVRDNGIGISEQSANAPDSIGLIGMQERARSFGGSLTIQGFPGAGTNVTATLPLTWGGSV